MSCVQVQDFAENIYAEENFLEGVSICFHKKLRCPYFCKKNGSMWVIYEHIYEHNLNVSTAIRKIGNPNAK